MLKIKDERLEYIYEVIKEAYNQEVDLKKMNTLDKKAFDLVTSIDFNMEKAIIKAINERFPDDLILSEETNTETIIKGNTWTIDPIDGTYNMANNLKMFGVQVSMYQDSEIVLALIYLPVFDEVYYAKKGEGCYLNHERITVKPKALDHAMVSFGDFSHQNKVNSDEAYKIMGVLKDKVAKIRMFGAACIDFSSVAAGKTNAVIIYTKNKWDIAPGILLVREAKGFVKDFEGDYKMDSNVVIATSDLALYEAIKQARL